MERKRIEQPGPINSHRSCAIGDTGDTKIKMTRQRGSAGRVSLCSDCPGGFLLLPVAWIQCRDTKAASRYDRLSVLCRQGEQNFSTPAARLQNGLAPFCWHNFPLLSVLKTQGIDCPVAHWMASSSFTLETSPFVAQFALVIRQLQSYWSFAFMLDWKANMLLQERVPHLSAYTRAERLITFSGASQYEYETRQNEEQCNR